MPFLFKLSDVISVNYTYYFTWNLTNYIILMTRDKFSNFGDSIPPLLIMSKKARSPSVGLGQLTEELADERC